MWFYRDNTLIYNLNHFFLNNFNVSASNNLFNPYPLSLWIAFIEYFVDLLRDIFKIFYNSSAKSL